MALTKRTTGQTNKYSNLAKSISKNKLPEEPKITETEVHHAFSSFNFPINDRGHNDILYWTQKPKSELPKLIETLHKKRQDINDQEDAHKKVQSDIQLAHHKAESDRHLSAKKAEDDKRSAHEDILNKQHVDKAAMPRLSDQDITALYDEFGLPKTDMEWARNHLPNDPKMIRNILSMQRKSADDLLKKHAKNAVNSIPEVQKNIPAPMGGMGGYSGRGGPGAPGTSTPMGMQGDMVPNDAPATPFFIGESAVCRITNPNNPNSHTLWLINPQKKTLQPFISEQAFDQAFDDPEEARKAIITLSSTDLGPNGVLNGFELLKGKQGVSHDGKVSKVEFSKAQISKRYGQQSDPNKETRSLQMLDGLLGKMK